MRKFFYRLCRGIVRLMFLIWLPLSGRGAENIPEDGAVILCGNHISLLDPLSIAVLTKRAVHFMAKKELFSIKPLGAILKALNAFPVDRKNSDMAAMRTSIAVLKEGGVLGIFPEGGRRREDQDRKLETGVGLMAIRSQAAVVPVRVIGPYRPLRRTKIIFGPPVNLSDLTGKSDGNALGEAMGRIEGAIFSLQ